MADRTSASIRIGSSIPASLIPDLLDAIASDDGRTEFGGPRVAAADLCDGDPLEICSEHLPGGIFTEIEALCEANGIPFVRNSCSCAGAFGPERAVFTGTGATEHFDLSECGELVVSLPTLRALGSIDAVETWFAGAACQVPPLSPVREMAEASHG